MFDTHLHTSFSPDSNIDLKDLVIQNRGQGLGVIITDHYEFCFEADSFHFDEKEYFETLLPFRSEKFLTGVEIGLNTVYQEKMLSLVKNNNFDYVLGSIHTINNEHLDRRFFSKYNKKEAYEKYLNHALQCLKDMPFINSFAHFDFISRYAPYPDPAMEYKQYYEILDEIFMFLAEKDIALEINLRHSNPQYFSQYKEIYQRFRELGGKYVTVGSDAHSTSEIGRNLQIGYELANHCSLTPVYFREGYPQFIDSKKCCAR